MGSFTENNDTLQITKEQGFPAELILETHIESPYLTGVLKKEFLSLKINQKFEIISNLLFEIF